MTRQLPGGDGTPQPAKRSKVGPLLLPISLAKRALMEASTSISFSFALGRSLPTFCSGQADRQRSWLSRPCATTLTDRPGKNDWRVTLGDFRERFYCDRVRMLNALQDIGNPHAVGRSDCGHTRLDAGIPCASSSVAD